MHRVTKAVLPAAGLGTRFLPATKALPKEMLPVVDRPAIQYVVTEAVEAGLHDVLMVTGRNKNALENHFDRATELEATLIAKGDVDRLAEVRQSTGLAQMHYVRQGDPLGLGHAVLRARSHVGGQSFAVLLGDDIIDAATPLLQRMLEVHAIHGMSVVALMEVEPDQAHRYGVATVEATDAEDVVRVRGLVEKPAPGTAPSNLAVIGRYVLRPEIFDVLEDTQPGVGGEIQLTDALRVAAADEAHGLLGVVFRGRRFDTGDRQGLLEATVTLASEREDLGAEFRAWLRAFVATLDDRP
ncbi:UTP--glucose-1-phosphate uridylyltransferase GalU [Agrococcus sp. SGAir0287]|uniref:UTP--glucose-1-phosphate uridylyltransferase GalU n=1 Tax=Agrococcus sp. SGAir0287 TaxID=2070347 RepID=UPI00158680D3|nr:UTP--glucose-1-phosphate uridylyltransferase GalU [Agrococcus sp. SGAir0287]